MKGIGDEDGIMFSSQDDAQVSTSHRIIQLDAKFESCKASRLKHGSDASLRFWASLPSFIQPTKDVGLQIDE